MTKRRKTKMQTKRLRQKEVTEGQNRINKLILCLTEQGRVEDLVRAASDTSYQKKLLQEFGL